MSNDNADIIEITEADIRKFAPKARAEYVTTLLGKLSLLRQAGILDSHLRWCHFIAQCGHETGGFVVTRESLNYTSVKRIREVWPPRFRSWSDADMSRLVRNPEALGDAVYGGRMGNRPKGDGHAFRGGYWLQSTGRDAVVKYAGALGLDPRPELLDDVAVTLEFAVLEWQQSRCCEYADENDIVAVSKAINVGSSASNVVPVNMDDRKAWFAKAWAIWGDKGKADRASPAVTTKEMVAKWLPIGGAGAIGVNEIAGVVKQGIPAVPEVATKSIEAAKQWKGVGTSAWELGAESFRLASSLGRVWPYLAVAGIAGGVLLLKARKPA